MDIKSLADPFIELANEMVSNGQEPEDVGEGMMWGTARYMAFILTRMSVRDSTPRLLIVDSIAEAFEQYVRHHLQQIPEESVVAHGSEASQAEKQLTAAYQKAQMAIGRGASHLDVVLTAWFRGAGQQELAEEIQQAAAARFLDDNWARNFALKMYSLWESGRVPQEIAIYAITDALKHVMLDAWWQADPVLDDQARQLQVKAYSDLRMHKVATVLRKDPRRFVELTHQGGVTLLGPKLGELYEAAHDARVKSAH